MSWTLHAEQAVGADGGICCSVVMIAAPSVGVVWFVLSDTVYLPVVDERGISARYPVDVPRSRFVRSTGGVFC